MRATREANVGGLQGGHQSGQIEEILAQKQNKTKHIYTHIHTTHTHTYMNWECSLVVECLPTMCEILSSIFSTTKRKERKGRFGAVV